MSSTCKRIFFLNIMKSDYWMLKFFEDKISIAFSALILAKRKMERSGI